MQLWKRQMVNPCAIVESSKWRGLVQLWNPQVEKLCNNGSLQCMTHLQLWNPQMEEPFAIVEAPPNGRPLCNYGSSKRWTLVQL